MLVGFGGLKVHFRDVARILGGYFVLLWWNLGFGFGLFLLVGLLF